MTYGPSDIVGPHPFGGERIGEAKRVEVGPASKQELVTLDEATSFAGLEVTLIDGQCAHDVYKEANDENTTNASDLISENGSEKFPSDERIAVLSLHCGVTGCKAACQIVQGAVKEGFGAFPVFVADDGDCQKQS